MENTELVLPEGHIIYGSVNEYGEQCLETVEFKGCEKMVWRNGKIECMEEDELWQ